jgi:hypothetical protein
MGFKLPGKSIQSGTSAHSSALKMVAEQKAASALKAKASPAKETDWAAMHAKANKKYNRYKKLTTEEYKKEALRQSAHHKKTGKWDAGGVYDHEGNKKETSRSIKSDIKTRPAEKVKEEKVKEEKQPRVEKEKSSQTSKTVHRKDGSVKKEIHKSTDKDEKGTHKVKQKETYRKDGGSKKFVVKTKDTGVDNPFGDKYRIKDVTKYDKKGDVKGYKRVEVSGGRRYVTKTNKKGETTTKSKRTLKGWLTGKGKKKKEGKTPDAPAKPE